MHTAWKGNWQREFSNFQCPAANGSGNSKCIKALGYSHALQTFLWGSQNVNGMDICPPVTSGVRLRGLDKMNVGNFTTFQPLVMGKSSLQPAAGVHWLLCWIWGSEAGMQSGTSWLQGLDWWSRELSFIPSSAFWMTTGIPAPLSVPHFPHPWNRSFPRGKSFGMLLENSHKTSWAHKKDDERFLKPKREGCTEWKGFLSEDVDIFPTEMSCAICEDLPPSSCHSKRE